MIEGVVDIKGIDGITGCVLNDVKQLGRKFTILVLPSFPATCESYSSVNSRQKIHEVIANSNNEIMMIKQFQLSTKYTQL